MMEDKYYTPSLEEFHVGFEYEEDDSEWSKRTFESYQDLEILNDDIIEGNIRVKKLDREDIESFGFDNYVPPKEYNHSWNYKGSKEPKLYVWFNNEFPVVRIYGSFPAILFQGTIKNKSEFDKILKQTGVI